MTLCHEFKKFNPVTLQIFMNNVLIKTEPRLLVKQSHLQTKVFGFFILVEVIEKLFEVSIFNKKIKKMNTYEIQILGCVF